jgi:hypothetical protein
VNIGGELDEKPEDLTMSVRQQCEDAYWDNWRRGGRDNPRDALPAFLDALEAIVREQALDSDADDARREAAELRAECNSLAGLLVDAAAERDRLRELLNEARIADPLPAPAGQPADPEPAKLTVLPAKTTPARPAARRRTRT